MGKLPLTERTRRATPGRLRAAQRELAGPLEPPERCTRKPRPTAVRKGVEARATPHGAPLDKSALLRVALHDKEELSSHLNEQHRKMTQMIASHAEAEASHHGVVSALLAEIANLEREQLRAAARHEGELRAHREGLELELHRRENPSATSHGAVQHAKNRISIWRDACGKGGMPKIETGTPLGDPSQSERGALPPQEDTRGCPTCYSGLSLAQRSQSQRLPLQPLQAQMESPLLTRVEALTEVRDSTEADLCLEASAARAMRTAAQHAAAAALAASSAAAAAFSKRSAHATRSSGRGGGGRSCSGGVIRCPLSAGGLSRPKPPSMRLGADVVERSERQAGDEGRTSRPARVLVGGRRAGGGARENIHLPIGIGACGGGGEALPSLRKDLRYLRNGSQRDHLHSIRRGSQ